MPVIYSSSSGTSNDGQLINIGHSSWANARDATSSSHISTTSQSSSAFTQVHRFAGRGGTAYGVYRSFVVFDTSGITGTVASATLSIYGVSQNDGSIIAVKSTAFGGDGGTALAKADFDAIVGWSAGSSLAGSATTYGSNIFKPPSDTWSTSGYNDFTATSDLLADMQNNDVVIICFMNYINDYLNSALTVNAFLDTGGYYANYTGTSRDPKIDYTLAATGYGDTVNGVAPANISKVNDVATANIDKVIGVD
tara:strand:- start:801 stop:1556 length:756 start_codon:yes stop_codon:yes gene_type:complete